MTHDLITIGITCYNAASTIAAAIKSAQAQDWPNLEIVIVDDASTDESVITIQAIIQNDLRCRLVRQFRNGGVAEARNRLVSEARGIYIAFFDDDDTSEPNRLAKQYALIKKTEMECGHNRIACYSSLRRYYPNGYQPTFSAIGSQGAPVTGTDVMGYLLHLPITTGQPSFFGNGTPCLTLMMSTQLIKDLGGFDPSLKRYEDAELALRLARTEGVFVGTSDILVHQTATSGVDKRPERTLEAELYIINKYQDIYRQFKQYRYARAWAIMRYHYYKRQWPGIIGWLIMAAVYNPVAALGRAWSAGTRRLRHERKMQTS
jgi:glycosyltransferase involved in cell wall biosynthesis